MIPALAHPGYPPPAIEVDITTGAKVALIVTKRRVDQPVEMEPEDAQRLALALLKAAAAARAMRVEMMGAGA